MIQRRTKTGELDAQLLANLLRINQIPLAYIPPESYQRLRRLDAMPRQARPTVGRCQDSVARLVGAAESVVALPTPFGPRGLDWFRGQDFSPIENMVRDEMLERFRHLSSQIWVSPFVCQAAIGYIV